MREYLSETLASGGYRALSFRSGAEALGWLASAGESVDLLLSDINMPGMNGLDLLRTVKTVAPGLPFILISGLCDLPTAHSALRAGATDYLLKPVRPADLLGLIARHVNFVDSARFEAVKEALRRTLCSREASGANRDGRLMAIFHVLGNNRWETLQHSRRVSAFSLLIARDLRLGREAHRALETGALLHDIGKAGIPHNVLMKPGKLNDEESAILRMHPQLGLDLLYGLPGIELEAEIVYSHHEFFDGTGYPRGLTGTAIPLGARIFSIVDALDALTSDRCYRPARGLPAARAEIHRATGTQFDPAIVELFDRVADVELETVRRQFPDES
jgi:putative nucleotidyltransferase with HDIG domain